MRHIALLTSLLLAVPALAQGETTAETAIRSQRHFGVQLEGGWNGLSGVGLLLNYHLTPMFTIDGGAGIGGNGFKLGARGRVNFGSGNVVPYLAGGYFYATGTMGESVAIEGDGLTPVTIGLDPAHFLQGVLGLEWIADGGFTAGANLGYAYQLGGQGSNINYVSGSPTSDERAAYDIAYGGGLVLAISLGYTF